MAVEVKNDFHIGFLMAETLIPSDTCMLLQYCQQIYVMLNLISKIINYLFISVPLIFDFLVFDINLFPVT